MTSERAFANVEQLRAYLRLAPDAAIGQRGPSQPEESYQQQAAQRREFLLASAEDKTLGLTPSGQLAVHKTRGTWW
ncbi:hypothetical protein ABZ897_60330 [Nonomuraea sp. NPDC046802]|uniref:hypothetical protein n=1 Tax=Nonomuraea sp. NPDC046802 TaxID=3154919 RepID=UPI0033D2079D